MDHHLLVLLQRPQQQQQQQQQHVLLQHPVLLQYTLLQYPLSSKDNSSTSSDILEAASHATAAAAVLIPGWTSTHMKVNVVATLGQKMSPVWAYFTKLHRRFRPWDEPRRESIILPASPCRQKECRLYTHNGTETLIRHLNKASCYIIRPRQFARNASHKRSCFGG